MIWNLLPPLMRQSECLCFPPAQLWQECVPEHKQCRCLTLCVFPLVSPVPSPLPCMLVVPDMLQGPRGLWCSLTSANTAPGGNGLEPPGQLWLLGWSSFRRSTLWHAWSLLVGRVSQKLASSKCSKSKRIWFYSLSNPIISACNVKDSVIQQFYFFPVPLLQMEYPNKV